MTQPRPACIVCAEALRDAGYREEDGCILVMHVTRCFRCGYDYRGQIIKDVYWFYI